MSITNARLAGSIESTTQDDVRAAAVRHDFGEVRAIYAQYGAFLERHPEAIPLLAKRRPTKPPQADFYVITAEDGDEPAEESVEEPTEEKEPEAEESGVDEEEAQS